MPAAGLMANVARLAGRFASPVPAPRSRVRRVVGDVFAGIIAGAIVLSYCLSFSSLLFPGALAAERPSVLWALLAGAVILSVTVSARTTLPPVIAAPDTAGVAVLASLGATVAAGIANAGGTPADAAAHMLLAFSLAGGLAGLVLLALGLSGTASYIRFIPYPVAAGFIGATGLLMMINSLKVVLPQQAQLNWSTETAVTAVSSAAVSAKIVVLLLTAAACIVARWLVRSSLTVPIVFLAATLVTIQFLGIAGPATAPETWFNSAVEPAVPWNAFRAVIETRIDWSILAHNIPEILAFSGVIVMSALIKTTNIEVSRAASADLDGEFAAMGWANVVCAACGGIGGTTQTTPSRAVTEVGATTRWAGYVCGLTIAVAMFTRVDLTTIVPVPVLAGLLMYFGWTSLMDMLGRPSAHLSWLDVALILVIIATCAKWGFETGGLIGFVLSCIIFVFRYRAIGVVRRHMTRANIASIVSRPAAEQDLLRARGNAVHLYWLSGYVFFGSSDALYERIRDDVEGHTVEPVRFLILDFTDVTGLDISALKSLSKLAAFCDRRGIKIAYTGLSARYRHVLESGRFIGSGGARAFETRSDALEWAEEALLSETRSSGPGLPDVSFDDWLREALAVPTTQPLMAYLERRECAAGTLLYAQGDDADTIEFVASGLIAITIQEAQGRKLRVRRMARQTVVGEMGFFRGVRRTASVEIEEPSVVFTMTRAAYTRMVRDDPEVAARLLQFVIRMMADRLEFANKEISALM